MVITRARGGGTHPIIRMRLKVAPSSWFWPRALSKAVVSVCWRQTIKRTHAADVHVGHHRTTHMNLHTLARMHKNRCCANTPVPKCTVAARSCRQPAFDVPERSGSVEPTYLAPLWISISFGISLRSQANRHTCTPRNAQRRRRDCIPWQRTN